MKTALSYRYTVLFSLLIVLAACSKKTVPSSTQAQSTDKPASTTVDMAVSGKQVFEAKCGRCHALKSPSEFTSQEWRPIMNRMADKAKLSVEEKTQVLTYVMQGAKTGK
ncbi:MAG: c-type cytochrome [Ferruginibacter sp.]